ncbi:MAG: hypothetical protein AB1656_16400 [Candidatus Omnitrophota bacterium]
MIAVSLLAAPVAARAAEIEVLVVSPRIISQDATGLFDQTATGHANIGMGEKAYLRVTPQADENWSGIEWSITQRPAASQAAIPAATAWTIAIQPDAEGVYEVTFSGVRNEEKVILSKNIVAASFVGAGVLLNGVLTGPQCVICHRENANGWKETVHAKLFAKYLNGEKTGRYQASFLQWHTLGYNPDPLARNSGFDDKMDALGIGADDFVNQINQAYRLRHDRNPKNDPDNYAALQDSLKDRSNVQCESCHGAGSLHNGNTARIGFTWSVRFCARCHDDFDESAKPYAKDVSGHSALVPLFRDYPVLLKTDCAKCHSAKGFVNIAVQNTPGAVYYEDPDANAVSCAACHDPHNGQYDKLLRFQGNVKLDSGELFENGGMGSVCVICHQSRIQTPLETFIATNSAGPHYGPQADMLLGVNAWDFGVPFDSADPTKYKIHKDLVQDTCAACHMAKTPANGFNAEGALVGGHSFKIVNRMGTASQDDDVSNVLNACRPCHLTIKTIDRPVADYDGNGKAEGIQTEVIGLLKKIGLALQANHPSIVIADDGYLEVPASVFNQMSFNEKAALHNSRMVYRDGSFGIHNPRYAVEALQRALRAL